MDFGRNIGRKGRLVVYHSICMVSTEAPYSPLLVRGLLEAYHRGPSAEPAETKNSSNRLTPEASGEG
jgi:hypothetical protein